jgi:hypothetical protein
LSIEAVGWALAQKLDRSSAKFVLVAMANCANESMECWPSVAYLSEATCQDRKTVLENIKRLKDAGIISDTEGRKGKTAQVTVYVINKEYQKRNSPENGTVPKTETKSPVIPYEQSRYSVEAVPKTGHGTINEPSIEPSKKQKTGAIALVDVSPEVMADFQKLRTAKKSPLTATALAGIRREAAKAGLSMQQAVEMCCERGWAGFKAEWLHEQRGRSPPAESFRERDQRLAKERYEEFVGIRRPVTDATIIEEVPDATPRILGR